MEKSHASFAIKLRLLDNPSTEIVALMHPLTSQPGFQVARFEFLSLRLVAGLCASALFVGMNSAAFAEAVKQPPAVILVGGSTDNYPYSYLDEQGRLSGFSVDVFDAAARAIGLKAQRVQAPSAQINRLFQDGEITIHPYFSQRAAHLGYADFSVPYLTLQGAIFVRRGDQRFTSLADLKLKKARISTGPAGRDYTLAHGFDPSQILVAGSEEAFRELDEGRSDAALFARLTGSAIIARHGFSHIELNPLQLEDYVLRNGFAVNPGQPRLLAQLNEGLAIISRNGEFEAIYQKWFGRLEPKKFSQEELIRYVAGALALALAVTGWALVRQHQLRARLSRQADELAHSQAVLADAQQFAHVGHWQRQRGQNDTPIWSPETYRIFERDPALGPPHFDELIAYGVDEDRQRWADVLSHASRENTPFDLEVRIEPRSGVVKTLHLRGRPTRDAAGHYVGLFGTVQDVTHWRAAQEALRQSEQLLRALYETLPHALGVADHVEGVWRLISINPGGVKLLGLDSAPPSGTAFTGLHLTPERLVFWNELFTRCITTATTISLERTEAQSQRDFAITVVPIASTGLGSRCCFFVEDITARNQRDAELSRGRRLRAIGELVGGIAHEFNNLLTPILLKADQLERHPQLSPDLHSELTIIKATTRRAADLTRKLLTFGRSNDRAAEAVDLATLIAGNVELVRQTSDRRIAIAILPLPALPALYLKSGDAHQIVLNLLINARDTLSEKLTKSPAADWTPRIESSALLLPGSAAMPLQTSAAGTPNQWIRLTVRDNGMGMPPAVLERIFEPFYTTKPVGAGTGLGLATVWHLITDLGGRIDVESAVGVGTSFHVYLPVGEPPPYALPSIPPLALVRLNQPFVARHLLVAEDEPMISKILTTVLRRAGHTVELADDGLTAWQLLSSAPEKFEAILTDLNMPGYSGLELARRARALGYVRPLIIMSGRVSEEDRAELNQLKIAAIIQKPFTPDELLEALAAVGIAHTPPDPAAR